jgi:sirohydrochlorin cobaltochelatase
VADALRAQRSDVRVELAFLEFMTPVLGDAVAAVLADGVVQVRIVPLFLAQGGHLKRDLPLLVDELRRLHPACRFELAAAVGEDQGVIDAMARCAGR